MREKNKIHSPTFNITLFINNINVWWKDWKDNSKVFALFIPWWRNYWWYIDEEWFPISVALLEKMNLLANHLTYLTNGNTANTSSLPHILTTGWADLAWALWKEVCASIVNSAEPSITRTPSHSWRFFSSLCLISTSIIIRYMKTGNQDSRTKT